MKPDSSSRLQPATPNTRRDFLRAAGLASGSLAGLGGDPRALAASIPPARIKNAREFASVCPYCAVGCGQIVSVREGQIINIEGNPDSPISGGTLCPKGSATFQLAVNPHRLTKVLYRKPYGTAWEEKPLDWAMDRIAALVKKTRDAAFQESWSGSSPQGNPVAKTVNHTLAIASLGGATMDNEWNYLHLKMFRALGGVWIENQARI
jgi:formate dehydrogenase major subunit